MATKKTAAEAEVKKVVAAPAAKRVCKRICSKKTTESIYNAINIGFKAGDVYQALAASETALNVKEIAKVANISEEETLLGMGWLFKEGKIVPFDDKVALA